MASIMLRPRRQHGRGDGVIVRMIVSTPPRWMMMMMCVIWFATCSSTQRNGPSGGATTTLLVVEATAASFGSSRSRSSSSSFGAFSSLAAEQLVTATTAALDTDRTKETQQAEQKQPQQEDDDRAESMEMARTAGAAAAAAGALAVAEAAAEMGSNNIEEVDSSHTNEDNNNGGEEVSWWHDMEFEEYNSETDDERSSSPPDGVTALDDSQLHPMLQIPLAVRLNNGLDHGNSIAHNHNHNPIRAMRAYCDSGATRTVMSYDTARRLGWLTQLDRRYAGQATSVMGSCRVLGRLPAGLIEFHLHYSNTCTNNNNHEQDVDDNIIIIPSPTITVLEDLPLADTISDDESDLGDDGFELLLGLDFLREYQSILDLRQEELRLLVNRKEYAIPFIRPRSSRISFRLQDEEEEEVMFNDNGKNTWGNNSFRGGRSPFLSSLFSTRSNDDDEDFDRDDTIDMSGL